MPHLPSRDVRQSGPRNPHTIKAALLRKEALPPPRHYSYPALFTPSRHLELDKFIAGRLCQMRTGISYLSTDRIFSPYEDPAAYLCPRCSTAAHDMEHVILHRPHYAEAKQEYIPELKSLAASDPVWMDIKHLHSLRDFIQVTRIGYPPWNPKKQDN